MVKLKKEAILISAIFVIVFLSIFAYADENQSNNRNRNSGEIEDEGVCEGLGQTECVSNLECEYDDEDLKCELKDDEREENESDDDNETDLEDIHTFLPWQKITEQQCPEECSCHGAVMSCKTEDGKTMTITAGNSGKVITLVINQTKVDTELELEQEGDNETNTSKFHIKKSNGKKSEIKIMPDVAAEMALEKLKLKVCSEENNCTIKLKDVGKDNETDNKSLKYEMQVERHARILGIFQVKAQERAEIDAENGKVRIHQPWWMFLAVPESE